MELREEAIYQGPEAQTEALTKDKVWEIIKTFKNIKSPGEDNICAELLNYEDKKSWEEIHALIEIIWTSERMPEKWCTAIICPIHKKEHKLQCNNYRGISLRNVCYKVLTNILHIWLVPYAEEILDYQCHFKEGRSTTDNQLC
jgi:sorting nexin-29